jgi:hypothetical protein
MDTALGAAAEIYIRFGRPFLDRVCGADSPLHTMSPEDLRSGRFDFSELLTTPVRMALVLARLRKTEGKLAESKAFAEYGLAHVGRATALRTQLEQLSNPTFQSPP